MGTVSRAINGAHWVSPAARKAVEDAVVATGYRANAHARNLRRRTSGTIAILVGESAGRLFADPNFGALVRDISSELDTAGKTMVLAVSGNASERTRVLDLAISGQVDGVIVVSWHDDEDILTELLAHGVPSVVIGIPTAPFLKRVSWVASDDYEGARMAVAHLRAQGRKRIALVSGPADLPGSRLRLDGYAGAIGSQQPLVAYGDYSHESGSRAAQTLIDCSDGAGIDAIFAANDAMAAGCIEFLGDRGISVPDSVAIVGFDDNRISRSTRPALTTIRQSFDLVAAEAVALLTGELLGDPAASTVIPVELVRRASA